MRQKTLCKPAEYKDIMSMDRLHVFLTREDVSNIFHVSEKTVDRWISSGDLKAIKIGNRVRISRDYIKQLMEGNQ